MPYDLGFGFSPFTPQGYSGIQPTRPATPPVIPAAPPLPDFMDTFHRVAAVAPSIERPTFAPRDRSREIEKNLELQRELLSKLSALKQPDTASAKSDPVSMGLISAGLGMIANMDKGFAGIGRGGLMGLESYQQAKAQNAGYDRAKYSDQYKQLADTLNAYGVINRDNESMQEYELKRAMAESGLGMDYGRLQQGRFATAIGATNAASDSEYQRRALDLQERILIEKLKGTRPGTPEYDLLQAEIEKTRNHADYLKTLGTAKATPPEPKTAFQRYHEVGENLRTLAATGSLTQQAVDDAVLEINGLSTILDSSGYNPKQVGGDFKVWATGLLGSQKPATSGGIGGVPATSTKNPVSVPNLSAEDLDYLNRMGIKLSQ